MAVMVPELSPVEKIALGVILEKGVIRGMELVSRSEQTAVTLLPALQKLIKYEFIESNRFLATPEDVSRAAFNICPFATGLAKDLIYR
jgi:hypothetical protein